MLGPSTAFAEFIDNGRVDDIELQALCKDGSIIDVSLSAVHYRDSDGGAGYSDAIWRDISARKRAEREIAKRDRKLTTLYLLGEQMPLSKALAPIMHNVAYCLYETLDAKSMIGVQSWSGKKTISPSRPALAYRAMYRRRALYYRTRVTG